MDGPDGDPGGREIQRNLADAAAGCPAGSVPFDSHSNL